LHGVVVEIKKCEAGLAAQPDCRRTDVQLGAGVAIRPEIVTRGHGPIRYRIHPVALAARLKAHRSLCEIHSPYDTGRVLAILTLVALRFIVLALIVLLILIAWSRILSQRSDGPLQQQPYARQNNSD